ncbi:hypothetical protein GS399_15540 [Pedobacter sp. HMF7647]|uniref:Universal stress protein n=1 Tax=Hufsiella arboris TaxID=2695275 RepID=A0A7K1YCS5_9SPHI|nr:hypothetical protein [Hufsiella arboris]MXV52387.1 hypothetical protein [Hufsiella arboris]
MKTILIPTDFTLKSLDCIPSIVACNPSKKLKLVLVHVMKVTDSMQDLLMLSRRSAEYKNISEDFYNTCAVLKRTFTENIVSIEIEFFYGSTVAVFKDFLETHEVDEIIKPDQSYQLVHKMSIDPAALLGRCGYRVVNVRNYKTPVAEHSQLEELV